MKLLFTYLGSGLEHTSTNKITQIFTHHCIPTTIVPTRAPKSVPPLLHCEIGIRNLLFKLLRHIINKHIENYTPGEQTIRESIPALQEVIASTATHRDEWDNSNDGNNLKTVKRAVAAYNKRYELVARYDVIVNEDEVRTLELNLTKQISNNCKTYAMTECKS